MKRESLFLFLLMATIWMGCKKDNTSCGAHQTYDATTKTCNCNPGYIGANCDTLEFQKYIGTYTGDLAIDSVHSTATYIIAQDSIHGVNIANYHNIAFVTGANTGTVDEHVLIYGESDADTTFGGNCFISANLDTLRLEFESNYHDTLRHNYVFTGLRQ